MHTSNNSVTFTYKVLADVMCKPILKQLKSMTDVVNDKVCGNMISCLIIPFGA